MELEFDLCVLIPAYNNFKGIIRIVDFFCDAKNVSVIVSDDSDDTYTAGELSAYISEKRTNRITYIKRVGKKGAVHNWNFLLTLVNAKYYSLVHHDEFHSDMSFLKLLSRYKQSSCFVLPFTVYNKDGVGRRVTSPLQRRSHYFLKNFLPIYNYIGPTSSLIISQDTRIEFDENLTWLIDTEWYYRVISQSEHISFASGTSFINSVFYEKSITWSSNGGVRALFKEELEALRKKYQGRELYWNLVGLVYCRSLMRLLGFNNYFSFYTRRFILYVLRYLFGKA